MRRGREARFLQVSTDEVYGELGATGYFDEASRYRPNSPYSASKAAASHAARAWFRTYGLPVLVSNSSNNYGPYQFPEKLIPLMVLNALAGAARCRSTGGVSMCAIGSMSTTMSRRCGASWKAAGSARPISLGRAARHTTSSWFAPSAGCSTRGGTGFAAPHARLIAFVTDRPGHDARYAVNPSQSSANSTGARATISSAVWPPPLTGTSPIKNGASALAAAYRQERLGGETASAAA